MKMNKKNKQKKLLPLIQKFLLKLSPNINLISLNQQKMFAPPRFNKSLNYQKYS